jgi:hypothetical protein
MHVIVSSRGKHRWLSGVFLDSAEAETCLTALQPKPRRSICSNPFRRNVPRVRHRGPVRLQIPRRRSRPKGQSGPCIALPLDLEIASEAAMRHHLLKAVGAAPSWFPDPAAAERGYVSGRGDRYPWANDSAQPYAWADCWHLGCCKQRWPMAHLAVGRHPCVRPPLAPWLPRRRRDRLPPHRALRPNRRRLSSV